MKTLFFKCTIIFLLIATVCCNSLCAQNTPDHLFSVTQGLQSPVRIAIDKQDIIYVTDALQKHIVRYDTSGTFLGVIEPGGTPVSIAINNKNQLFIGDAETGSILKLDEFGAATEFYTETLFPSSMVFNPDNLLYVVDSKLKQVIVLNEAGNVTQVIGAGTFVSPTGIAYDPLNELIYVSEHGGIGTGFKPTVKIWIFDLEGNLLDSYGSHGKSEGKFYRIQGLAIGRCGNLFATDPFQGMVSIFDEFGFNSRFGEYGNQPGNLNVPLDIAIDSRQHIWITSMNNGALEVYSINVTAPTSHISSAKPTICTGDSTNIEIEFTGTAPWNFTYTVDGLNPKTISNTTDNPYVLTVAEAGLYKITALSDANNVATCFSGSVSISLNTLPNVSLGENVTACEAYMLDAGASFSSYLWNDGSTNQTLEVTASGTYSVTVSNDNGCMNFDEIEITVNMLPLPEFTYIQKYLEVEFENNSTNAEVYVWNFGDNKTSNEINPVHIYNTQGNYSVSLTVSNKNCSTEVVKLENVLVDDFGGDFAKIYPNPSNGIFTIEIYNPSNTEVEIGIVSVTGKRVYTKIYQTQKAIDQIDLSTFPNGIYRIEFTSGDLTKMHKIVINR